MSLFKIKPAEKHEITYLDFMKEYVDTILETQQRIEEELKSTEDKNGNAKNSSKRIKFLKDLLILRYASLHFHFLKARIPKNQTELSENLTLIMYAFYYNLDNRNLSDSMSWLIKGFAEYLGSEKLSLHNLNDFELNFSERVVDKITALAMEYTDGRFDDENQAIINLIKTVLENDSKVFDYSVKKLRFTGTGL